ncbi:MAG: hypothetical protein RLZZ454_515 [Pseudomonadota bacterium]
MPAQAQSKVETRYGYLVFANPFVRRSSFLVFFILAGLWWAIHRGQFEDIEAEGERILRDS